MYKLKILILITILICSCESNKNDEKKEIIIFNGITTTDDFGDILSADTSDWKLNDTLNMKESSLFEEKMNNYCTSNISDFSIRAYPNPCSKMVYLNFNFPTGYTITLKVVDRNYKLLLSLEDNLSKNLSLNFSDFNISNDTIRIYYKFHGDNCELNGHGDIKIK